MASISAAVSNFIQSLIAIATSLLNSLLSVLQAVLALGEEFVGAVLQLVQAFVAFGTDLFGSLVGFVAGECVAAFGSSWRLTDDCLAHFVVVLLLGGGYYWYTHTQSGRRASKKLK